MNDCSPMQTAGPYGTCGGMGQKSILKGSSETTCTKNLSGMDEDSFSLPLFAKENSLLPSAKKQKIGEVLPLFPARAVKLRVEVLLHRPADAKIGDQRPPAGNLQCALYLFRIEN